MKVINTITNSNPCLIHFNGSSKRLFKKEWIEEIVESSNITLAEDLTIITFKFGDIETHLINQLEKCNIPYINACDFVEIDKWEMPIKLDSLKIVLKEIETKYVLCLDCNDVLLSDNFSEIVNRFKELNQPIVYASSVVRHPNVDVEGEIFPIENELYNTINGGCVIAETKAYTEFINICKHPLKGNRKNSEQFILRYYSKEGINIDSSCYLFQVLNRIEFEYNSKNIICKQRKRKY